MELSALHPAASPDQASHSAAAAYARMPAFASGTHEHRHTIDSALVSLAMLGVPAHRIQVRRAGRQLAPPGTVVLQRPAAGEPLTPATLVELEVSGLGFAHALPVGLWDSGGETHAGTREILEGFDDPLEKLKHWFHEGAPLFRIAPDDPEASRRWLALFGVRAADWPRELWFRLASLIARMAQLSCSESGCALVLEILLGLPVRTFTRRPTYSKLPAAESLSLGRRGSQLGVSTLLGTEVEGLATLVVELGPVPLATYARFVETEAGTRLLQQTLHLLMPCSSPYEIIWAVLDPARAPRLGIAEANARLGINTHMGQGLGSGPPPAAAPTLPAAGEAAALEAALAEAAAIPEIHELHRTEPTAGSVL